MGTAAPGQISIKVSSGPNCHSMADVKMVVEILLTHHGLPFEPTAVQLRWKQVVPRNEKLCFGLMVMDGVVHPQPPIARALRETATKLRDAGHEGTNHIILRIRNLMAAVIEYSPPFDCWEATVATVCIRSS